MPHKLKPIKPKRISDQVFDQLRELIFRGEFKTGEKILTERELAEAFGVSRTSVRDAINKLVVMGLLEQRQGQGTFVRSPESTHWDTDLYHARCRVQRIQYPGGLYRRCVH